MSRPITAAVVRESGGQFALEEVEVESPRPDELLVRVVAAGICHADLIARDQLYPVPLPGIFGHEGAGIVEEVGADVEDFAAGDRVILTVAACRHCSMCETGRPYFCDDGFRLNFGGARSDGSSGYSRDGAVVHGHFSGQSSFATHSLVAASGAVKLPDDVSFETLAPFACGVMTGVGTVVNSLRVPAGATVAVFGVGAVGLSAVIGAGLVGAARIVAVDVNPSRLGLARRLGATETIEGAPGTDVTGLVREACDGGAHFAVEASGDTRAARQAVDSLAVGGSVGMVGVTSIDSEVTLRQQALVHGLTIKGVLAGECVPREFLPRLFELHGRGLLPVEEMIQTFPFERIESAVAASESGEVVKAVLTME
jgi:aryl-alcohol dehydrogenase